MLINVDGHPTISVMRTYTPITLLAIAGMTDTRRAVAIKVMGEKCDATHDESHPLSRGSVATRYAIADQPATGMRVVTMVCVACGRYGNTEAKHVPGADAPTQ